MTRRYPYLKYGLLLFLLIIGGVIIYFTSTWYKNLQKENEVSYLDSEFLLKKENENLEKDIDDKKYLLVDIKGAVVSPSVYSIEEGKCVMDAINQAGLLENADTSMLNLSKRLYDQMVIIVYTKEEISNYIATKKEEEVKNDYCMREDVPIKNNACIIEDNKEEGNAPISLSKASLEELMTLPHIGEAKAKAIILYRSEHNGFQSVEELLQISGIGENIFAEIKNLVTP